MNKKISSAFGKKIYLIGKDSSGVNYWLEEPRWDCDWYWGFGYMETYTNNKRPDLARDRSSHSHWDGFCQVKIDGKYIHHINESPELSETVLTENESWELSDLMKSFYTLKETATLFHQGNSYLTSKGIDLKDKTTEDMINQVVLPKIFSRIAEILSPA
jgi:hypothetical protein